MMKRTLDSKAHPHVDPDRIAELCYENYLHTLPKRGKPKEHQEWTMLACFLTQRGNEDPQIVSSATGTKSSGRNNLYKNGWKIHDSHAEVLARRAYQRYLMCQAEDIYSGRDSIFTLNTNNELLLPAETRVIFFTSQTPCGDASIFKRPEGDIHPEAKKRKVAESLSSQTPQSSCHVSGDNAAKNEEEDMYRTGAKCVPGATPDPLAPGVSYHTMGVLRTKPGRGDPTISMSCSDKIAKWTILGCQGCLLMTLLATPIYIDTVVVGGCPFDGGAMIRALHSRMDNMPTVGKYTRHKPMILQSKLQFKDGKQSAESSGGKVSPCATSSIWHAQVTGRPHLLEISVNGFKQGVTKKSLAKPSCRLQTSRIELYILYLSILKRMEQPSLDNNSISVLKREITMNTPYNEAKQLSDFFHAWKTLKAETMFNLWISKEDSYSRFTAVS